MKKHSLLSILLLLFLVIIISSCKKEADKETEKINNQIVAQWELVSDSILTHSGVPGMIIGIWAPDRNLQWVVGKGKANRLTGEAPNPSMKYRMGSLTKTYTYTVLLQLVDEGKINLADKLISYLPDFPKADSITIRMLCNHTSGIFDYTESNLFQYALFTDPFYKWSSTEMIDLVKTEPFYFNPGTAFKYSNTNTIIIGKIIEDITGNLISSEIQQRILDPLHLTNTIYPAGLEISGAFVHGYGWYDGDTTDVSQAYDPSMAGAAGAMVADVYDMKNWVEHLAKGTLLSTETQSHRLTVIAATDEDCEEYGL